MDKEEERKFEDNEEFGEQVHLTPKEKKSVAETVRKYLRREE